MCPGWTACPTLPAPCLRAGEEAGRKSIVVEVPPLGFVCVAAGSGQRAGEAGPATVRPLSQGRRLPAPSADGRSWSRRSPGGAVLRNEFFELAIDPHTGAVRSIFDFHSRAPRLAQQVAMRLPRGRPTTRTPTRSWRPMRSACWPRARWRARSWSADGWSIAAVNSWPAFSNDPRHLGQPRDRGGNRTRSPASTGRRPVEFVLCGSICLGPGYADPLSQRESSDRCRPTPCSWNRRTSSRFAARRGGTTILTAGLPYHRRHGMRKLDSLLLVRGETARRFRLGIGIDLPQPMAAALDFAAPSPWSRLRRGPGTTRPGFSISIRAR